MNKFPIRDPHCFFGSPGVSPTVWHRFPRTAVGPSAPYARVGFGMLSLQPDEEVAWGSPEDSQDAERWGENRGEGGGMCTWGEWRWTVVGGGCACS